MTTKASDFVYNKWEIDIDGNIYIFELDNEALVTGDRLFPSNELMKKGVIEQIESFIQIFTLKNHKHLSGNIIRKIAKEIIEDGSVEDILPDLQSEYINAYEKVFTSKGAEKAKKISFKKI